MRCFLEKAVKIDTVLGAPIPLLPQLISGGGAPDSNQCCCSHILLQLSISAWF